jgi:N-terminal domain of reverse transcriptase
MTTAAQPLIGAASTSSQWDALNWQTIKKHVRRLQMRIAQVTREGRWGKVKALQWLLSHSFSAKRLAAKRVVSINESPAQKASLRCEPYDGKLSSPVLRGPETGNRRGLLGGLGRI